ncbi:hypothetical protein N7522_002445 [Penicillium canescens]|nr:hypothetical protein N7522_002445 [Penicillium canescens]
MFMWVLPRSKKGPGGTRRPWLLKLRSSTTFIIGAVWMSTFTEFLLYAMIVPVMPTALVTRAGVEYTHREYWVSVLLMCEAGTSLILCPLFGYLVDRGRTRRLPFICALILLVGCMLILQLARSVAVFVVARLVQGITGALVVVASFALIGDAVPQYRLGQTIGYLGSAIASGFLLGPFLGGIVYNAGGYDSVFWFAYPIITIDMVMRLALVEKKVAAEWTGPNGDLESDLDAEQRNHAAVPCEPVAVPRKKGWVLLKMLKQRRVLISSGVLLVQGLLLSALDATLPIFVEATFGWNSLGMGLIFLPMAVPAFFEPLFGFITDRLGARFVSFCCFVALSPTLICLRFVEKNSTGQVALLVVLLFLTGIFTHACAPAMYVETQLALTAMEANNPGVLGPKGAVAQGFGLQTSDWALFMTMSLQLLRHAPKLATTSSRLSLQHSRASFSNFTHFKHTTTTMPPANKTWHIQQRAKTQATTQRYTCPAETTPHLATLLSFPSRRSLLPELHEKTSTEIINLAKTIATFEPVRLHVRPEDLLHAQSLLDAHQNPKPAYPITLIPAPTNHVWIRDTGPVYVRGTHDNTRYAIDFQFCEWGHKTGERIYGSSASPAAALALESTPAYADWPVMDEAAMAENTNFARAVLDLENEAVAAQLPDASPEPVTRVSTHIRLEGGGIEIDGEGTFMATESSIVGPARNPGLSRSEIEEELSRLLSVTKFIWFPGRVGLDVTDVHIDAEARFVRPGVVVVCRPHESAEKVHWEVYEEIREVLRDCVDARGRKVEVHDVVEPDPRFVKGDLPGEEAAPAASYVNFYFANGGLVMPAFGDAVADERAFELMKSLVPERVVKQVAVNALPRTGGVLHCVTQQVL